jgi:hypothetical protein
MMNPPPWVMKCTGGRCPAVRWEAMSSSVGLYTSASISPCRVGIAILVGLAIAFVGNWTSGDEYSNRDISGNTA